MDARAEAGWSPPPVFATPERDDVRFEVRDARGDVIERLAASGSIDLPMPPPVAVEVTVVDAEGQPVVHPLRRGLLPVARV